MSAEQFVAMHKRKGASKYNAVRTEYNGKFYPSKAEARAAEALDLRMASGEFLWKLEQVGIMLGDQRYVTDFVVQEAESLRVYAIDEKGVETPAFGKVRRLWSKYGPFELHVTRQGKTVDVIQGATRGNLSTNNR